MEADYTKMYFCRHGRKNPPCRGEYIIASRVYLRHGNRRLPHLLQVFADDLRQEKDERGQTCA
jgi:hypothetical protein